jgi:iron complex transport system ATP-binding protein
MLAAVGVTVRYAGADRPALLEVSAEVRPRRLLAVVGPNGSGKTTLLRALLGSVRTDSGRVELEGRPVRAWSPGERARLIGVVTQREEYPFAWRAREVVMFGRYPWLGALAPPGPRDRTVVKEAMARCDVSHLGDRQIDTLSGGEWQRVRIARALAQEPRLLVLDEPGAALDLGHEMELFELIRQLVDEGLGGIVVTHQLNVAARFADEMLVLAAGRTTARGTPREVLDPARLSAVFDWPLRLGEAPEGAPQLVPERRGSRSRPADRDGGRP